MTVVTSVDASKQKLAADQALGVLTGATRLIAAKGKKVETFELKANRPTDDELLAVLLGPTGNLRAPTAKVGSTVVVGFNSEAYTTVFG